MNDQKSEFLPNNVKKVHRKKHNPKRTFSAPSHTIVASSSTPKAAIKGKPSDVTISESEWAFEADYNDHFETPPNAYADLSLALRASANWLNIQPSQLTIYDPYYCQGSMIRHLQALGFPTVINQNCDFYAEIKKKRIPEHNILVTNPPYSGEHKTKLMDFLLSTINCRPKSSSSSSSSKESNERVPFALLLPTYTVTKSYWKNFVDESAKSGMQALYLLPQYCYEYSHPEGTGKALPPFYSAWFLGNLDGDLANQIKESYQGFRGTPPTTGGRNDGLRVPTRFTLAISIDQIVSMGLVVVKRPNPKQRHKMKLKTSG